MVQKRRTARKIMITNSTPMATEVPMKGPRNADMQGEMEGEKD